MRVLLLCLILLLSAGLFTTTVFGQDCSTQDMTQSVEEDIIPLIADNPARVFRVIDQMRAFVRFYESACAANESLAAALPEPTEELVFSLEGEGQVEEVILDAVEIPDGDYRVQIVTNGYFFFKTEVDGGCIRRPRFTSVLYGEGTQGVEFLLASSQCRVTFSVTANGNWRLDFYPFSVSDFELLDETYSSETEGLVPIIGPVRIADGTYIATLVSDGPICVEFAWISGECDFGHDEFDKTLFNSTPSAFPKVRTTITSNDCYGYFMFNEADAPWTLTFEPLQ
jgi:hypothetical protein